ncbi:uncharacterized protein LOC105186548 [Harpegnathos saltator]|uniref:Uncharacterized protein KIAA1467-like protein n=1 Tax=Harpegnathos saltator TaxID=610380 RepID=E2BU50_HARSA|nr:uncharacterized protein LOC105186548 [Harpegnathos saltator]EFN80767.1 Uncharacterized protein KIAA1467-like protein [Harpegnathos saltator]
MSAVYPTAPKLAVRDSIDDDDLTDIDDEVFIRDGRNGALKLDDDGGVKRPLMAPRRKCKKSCSFQTHKFPYKALLIPLCYGITALTIVLGLIILCIFTANIFPMPLTILKNWLTHELKDTINKSEIIPCTSLSSKVLWKRSLPKLTSEAPLRSNDVNLDGIEDIIIGFSTGLDTLDASQDICTVYFGNQTPCLGGVLALNGKTGETIWTHWTAHAIFSIDCGVDLTSDKVKDCIISGRGGILQAINGHDGSNIWEMPIQNPATSLGQQRILDVYDARFMADMDGDGIGDVIASHAMQTDNIRMSNMLIISGKSGSIIRNLNLPESEQLFIAPQILVHPDGENVFVLATNSQKQAGGLYIVSQGNIFYGDLQLRELYHNTGKGALLPPILVDITLDEIEDIVVAMFNSTIMAYNGLTFEPIWNYTVPNSEVISIPIPGYYNDDDVPDFMVKHQIGAGFPTYYYTVATIVDGRNGQSLLEKPMEDSLSRQMSGLSITVDGYGNDWFLHWSADCLNYEGIKEKYQFLKGQSLMSQTHADLCRLRFNSTLITKLLALSQHVGPPGVQLYFSEDWKSLELNNSIDPRQEAERYWDSHPRPEVMDTYADIPLVSERSPKVHKNHRKDGIFRHKDNNLLAEIGKYDSDAVYENFDEFKSHKSRDSAENDAADNLDVNRMWKHDDKWTKDNAQLDKEYDGMYGADDGGNNEDGEQSMDYSQAIMREQRSVSSGMALGNSNSTNISQRENISEETKEVTRNEVDTMNIIVKFQEEISSTTSNTESRSNVKGTTLGVSTTDTSAVTSEPTRLKNTKVDFEASKVMHGIEILGVTESQKNTDYQERNTPRTDKIADITQQKQIYKDDFSNIFQDIDDEASIEKIFKRESLKNLNKNKDNRKQTLTSSSVADKTYKIRLKRQIKGKLEVNGGRSSEINGIQKQPPTGILLPSIAKSKGRTSVDLIFSTFWLPSSEVSLILSQKDLECIQKALSENKLQYKKEDDIVNECLLERGVNYRLYQESMDRENTRIPLGQMTIYRMKLECVCPEDMLPNQICKNISLYQSWPAHLGSSGNGHFKPLRRLNI